jgi:hypothetical protein
MAQTTTRHITPVIAVTTILTIAVVITTLFTLTTAKASNRLITNGDIEICDANGVKLTRITFQQFNPGQQSIRQQAFSIRNTGKHPLQVSWSISESSIGWNQLTKQGNGYSHSANEIEKYDLRIGEEIGKNRKYLQPERNSLHLSGEESAKLFFELTYSGKPNAAEVFTLTITFVATSAR